MNRILQGSRATVSIVNEDGSVTPIGRFNEISSGVEPLHELRYRRLYEPVAVRWGDAGLYPAPSDEATRLAAVAMESVRMALGMEPADVGDDALGGIGITYSVIGGLSVSIGVRNGYDTVTVIGTPALEVWSGAAENVGAQVARMFGLMVARTQADPLKPTCNAQLFCFGEVPLSTTDEVTDSMRRYSGVCPDCGERTDKWYPLEVKL